MSEKRKRHHDDDTTQRPGDKKRQRKGFTVGPANLPDGSYKRKTQKIKQGLIDKAKIKKDYAKLKKQGKVPEDEERLPQPASVAFDAVDHEPSNEPHPDRQTLIQDGAEKQDTTARESGSHVRRSKTAPFRKEHEQAMKRRAEAEERRRAREDAERERLRKIEERERFRRAMAKARTGGPNGQRKLGRESKVLLEKVKRMVEDSG